MSEDSDAQALRRQVADLKSSDLYVRIEAALALGRRGDRSAVEPLIDALDDDEWRGSLAAVEALGELGDARAVEPIVHALRQRVVDSALFACSIEFSNAATTALQNLGEAGFQSLVELALEFTEWEFPGVAIVVTLGEMRDLRALDTLIIALRSSVYEVTQAAAEAVSGFGEVGTPLLIAALHELGGGLTSPIRRVFGWRIGPEAIPALLAALEDTDDAGFRADLTEVLGSYDDEQAKAALHRALTDPDEGVREAAAFPLGERGNPRAIEQLLVTPQRNGGSNLPAMTLAQIGEPAVEPLIAALGDSLRPTHARVNAATALGSIGDVRAFDALLAALQASDPSVVRAAAHALGELKDARAVEPLLAALDRSEDTVHASILDALGALGDDRSFEITVAAATNPNESPRVRKAAILALGPGYGDRALPILRDILVGGEGFATPLASIVITRHEANAVPILIEVASTAQWEQASKAMWALRIILIRDRKDPRIVDFLVASLQHPDWRIRQQAARSLGQLGDTRAIDALIECLNTPYFGARFNAAQMLSEIGDERALPALERALTHVNAIPQGNQAWAESIFETPCRGPFSPSKRVKTAPNKRHMPHKLWRCSDPKR